jgi:hypothetical protein
VTDGRRNRPQKAPSRSGGSSRRLRGLGKHILSPLSEILDSPSSSVGKATAARLLDMPSRSECDGKTQLISFEPAASSVSYSFLNGPSMCSGQASSSPSSQQPRPQLREIIKAPARSYSLPPSARSVSRPSERSATQVPCPLRVPRGFARERRSYSRLREDSHLSLLRRSLARLGLTRTHAATARLALVPSSVRSCGRSVNRDERPGSHRTCSRSPSPRP